MSLSVGVSDLSVNTAILSVAESGLSVNTAILSVVESGLSVSAVDLTIGTGLSVIAPGLSVAAEFYGLRKRFSSFERLTVSGKIDHYWTAQQENELR
ncbi:hypothetical protein OYT88_17650 [Sporolactobacillus sp. CQH2019]|uniref:hypothetical protein n=1 Tax=Sporolactobacillus sp. CQH2019 TaxID=3023512 RepID=UPI002367D6EF|nr:hypothetical protein [Sporolactobacillus sp. CQH2019]MDD9150365.1 hypothetical protein [Sporolactobacillus sp. CQH2019]